MALLLLSLFLLGTRAAEAIEYNRPDPPGAMSFDRVTSRVVPVPSEKVPESCDAQYRAGMESSFRRAWSQCSEIGQTEPSDCQRALFDRCTQLAADLQKLEAQTCTAMIGEGDALGAFRAVDNQKTAQASTADLNTRAYVATQKVIQALKANQASLMVHRNAARGALSASACAQSSESARYGKAEAVVTGAMDQAKAHLDATIARKTAAAAQFSKNSGRSSTNLAQLVSAAPAKSTITSATSSASAAAPTVYTGTVVQTVTGGSAPLTTTTTTSSTTSTVVTTGTPPPPAPALFVPSSESRQTNWVPILAAGIPAAVLTAIVVSKLSKNKADAGQPDGLGPEPGPAGVPDPSGRAMPGSGNRNPAPSVVPGGGDLAAWKIWIDPSFTDRERAIIAAGFVKIPGCYRYKLQGLRVKSARLKRLSDGCIAGMFIFGGDTVYLSPSCTVAIGVTVHELMHVIGNRNDNAVHRQWKPVSDRYPRCPVTSYAATNYYEDFAESGRLLLYPDSSAEAKNAGACVDSKIQGLGQILNACPQP